MDARLDPSFWPLAARALASLGRLSSATACGPGSMRWMGAGLAGRGCTDAPLAALSAAAAEMVPGGSCAVLTADAAVAGVFPLLRSRGIRSLAVIAGPVRPAAMPLEHAADWHGYLAAAGVCPAAPWPDHRLAGAVDRAVGTACGADGWACAEHVFDALCAADPAAATVFRSAAGVIRSTMAFGGFNVAGGRIRRESLVDLLA